MLFCCETPEMFCGARKLSISGGGGGGGGGEKKQNIFFVFWVGLEE